MLEKDGMCVQSPEEHQRIEGKVLFQGQLWNRSVLAGRWEEKFCERIRRTALKSLQTTESVCHCACHAEAQGKLCGAMPVSAVAHLHSACGHVSNDRLVRMLMLSGAGQQIQAAARNRCCQTCNMVRPPRDAPQVALTKPKTFNEKLTGDAFYVWDIIQGDEFVE